MFNLYSVTKPRATIRELAKVTVDILGKLPPLPEIFPDKKAPVVVTRPYDGQRELLMMRWGLPPTPGPGVGEIKNFFNADEAWLRPDLRPYYRCLIPVTSFCKYEDMDGKTVPTWYARDEMRPPFFFAGIWQSWRGVRGSKPNAAGAHHMLFAILVTKQYTKVGTVRDNAKPVLLLTEQEREKWMTASAEQALELQKPEKDGTLMVVGRSSIEAVRNGPGEQFPGRDRFLPKRKSIRNYGEDT